MATTTTETATWEQYEALPENPRTEYIDGRIFYIDQEGSVMAAAPRISHQRACARLARLLEQWLPEGLLVVNEAGWKPGQDEFRPDVMVIPETDEDLRFTGTPVLCVEVVSSNAVHDYVTKARKYAEAGLEHYWIVDPVHGSLTALVREGDHFEVDVYVLRDEPQHVNAGFGLVRVDVRAILG